MNKCAINRRYSFFSDHHITQEYINGELYTVDMLCDKQGNSAFDYSRRTLAQKDGTDFKCVVERNEQLISLCNKTSIGNTKSPNIKYSIHHTKRTCIFY